jgi:hypothetical protein
LTEEKVRKTEMAQKRPSAYRSLVFWTWPDIGKHRRALPCCVYAMISATFMPTSDEEFADMDHTEFVADAEDL